MSTMKKTATEKHASDRKFPEEAYHYNDDVTKEAVETVRDSARHLIENGDWEVIDGFGRHSTR